MGCSASATHPQQGGLSMGSSHLNIKCAILGNASVGKSSITQRYLRNRFSDAYDVTLGGVYAKKEITLTSGEPAWLHIWDTGGEERYRAIAPLYYRDAALALLVCSVDEYDTLKGLEYWIEELSERRLRDSMSIIVVANKCDLDDRQFSTEQGEEWASKHHVVYKEVSAKTGEGIKELFDTLIASYVQRAD